MNVPLEAAAVTALVAATVWLIACVDVFLREHSQAVRVKSIALRTVCVAVMAIAVIAGVCLAAH